MILQKVQAQWLLGIVCDEEAKTRSVAFEEFSQRNMGDRRLTIHLLDADRQSVIQAVNCLNIPIVLRIENENRISFEKRMADSRLKGMAGVFAVLPTLKTTRVRFFMLKNGNHTSIFSTQFNNADIDRVMADSFSDYTGHVLATECVQGSLFRASLYKGSERVAILSAEIEAPNAAATLSMDNSNFIASIFSIDECVLQSVVAGTIDNVMANLGHLLGIPIILTAEEIERGPKKYGAEEFSYSR